MATILIRFWAGAKAAAGVETETVEAATVAQALAAVLNEGTKELASVIGRSSLLLDGSIVHDKNVALVDGQTLEVLPPFAGGAF